MSFLSNPYSFSIVKNLNFSFLLDFSSLVILFVTPLKYSHRRNYDLGTEESDCSANVNTGPGSQIPSPFPLLWSTLMCDWKVSARSCWWVSSRGARVSSAQCILVCILVTNRWVFHLIWGSLLRTLTGQRTYHTDDNSRKQERGFLDIFLFSLVFPFMNLFFLWIL